MIIKGVIYLIAVIAMTWAMMTYLHAPYFLALVVAFVGIFAWRGLWKGMSK